MLDSNKIICALDFDNLTNAEDLGITDNDEVATDM